MEPLTQQPLSQHRLGRTRRRSSSSSEVVVPEMGPGKRKAGGAAVAAPAAIETGEAPTLDAVVALPPVDGFLGMSEEDSDAGVFKSGDFVEKHRLQGVTVRPFFCFAHLTQKNRPDSDASVAQGYSRSFIFY